MWLINCCPVIETGLEKAQLRFTRLFTRLLKDWQALTQKQTFRMVLISIA
jgi:hypothetical protein